MLAGWALLWRYGSAFVLEGPAAVEGYGWPGYLNNAWMVFHRQDVGFDRFRLPLHGWLVGAAGEPLGSYVDGAVVVSSVSMGLAVAAAALAAPARPWAGPWPRRCPAAPYSADAAGGPATARPGRAGRRGPGPRGGGRAGQWAGRWRAASSAPWPWPSTGARA